jgi:hypothetical protein
MATEAILHGWKSKVTADGAVCFINEDTGAVVRQDPRDNILLKDSLKGGDLPEGWEASVTYDGRLYFFDRSTGRTAADDPRAHELDSDGTAQKSVAPNPSDVALELNRSPSMTDKEPLNRISSVTSRQPARSIPARGSVGRLGDGISTTVPEESEWHDQERTTMVGNIAELEDGGHVPTLRERIGHVYSRVRTPYIITIAALLSAIAAIVTGVVLSSQLHSEYRATREYLIKYEKCQAAFEATNDTAFLRYNGGVPSV